MWFVFGMGNHWFAKGYLILIRTLLWQINSKAKKSTKKHSSPHTHKDCIINENTLIDKMALTLLINSSHINLIPHKMAQAYSESLSATDNARSILPKAMNSASFFYCQTILRGQKSKFTVFFFFIRLFAVY